MRVLITGVAGFIGAALADRLLRRGDSIIGVDNLNDYYDIRLKEARRDRLAELGGDRFHFLAQDFADSAGLEAALSDVEFDSIVHLGAQPGVRFSIENPLAYAESNLIGHLNILELGRHRATTHMVYASSSSVYGGNSKLPFSVEDRADHPVSLYAATKKADELMSETYAHVYGLPLTGLRFFTVYGPWGRPDMMMWSFTQKILTGEPIPVFNNGEMWRDFTYIDDIVSGIVACLDRPPSDDGTRKTGGSTKCHALYNIGNHRSEPLMKVIRLIEKACDRKAQLSLLPMQPGDVVATHADIEATQIDFGFRPSTPIEIGVPSFVAWFRSYMGL